MEIVYAVCAALLYFLPSYLASGRRNFYTIFLINIFLGWTGFGWAFALVMALTGSGNTRHSVPGGASVPDELLKLKALLDEGLLTREEFEREKARILQK